MNHQRRRTIVMIATIAMIAVLFVTEATTVRAQPNAVATHSMQRTLFALQMDAIRSATSARDATSARNTPSIAAEVSCGDGVSDCTDGQIRAMRAAVAATHTPTETPGIASTATPIAPIMLPDTAGAVYPAQSLPFAWYLLTFLLVIAIGIVVRASRR